MPNAKGMGTIRRRGIRPPNSPGCRAPPPQNKAKKNALKIVLSTHNSHERDLCSRPMKETEHKETDTTDIDKNLQTKKQTSQDKAEWATHRPLTPQSHTQHYSVTMTDGATLAGSPDARSSRSWSKGDGVNSGRRMPLCWYCT